MYKTLSVGEVLWDIFPNYKKPGGSPANVAYHLHCLGAKSLLLSRVGDDENGIELASFLNQKNIDSNFLQIDKKQPTGVVHVTFNEGEPSYTIEEPSAWDYIEVTDQLKKELGSLNAFCFASLSQRNETSRQTIQKILSMIPKNCLRVFDLNLREPFVDQERTLFSIQKSDIVKINEHEFEQLAGWFGSRDFIKKIIKNEPHKIILLTEGKKGSTLFTANKIIQEEAHSISGKGDFVGVGDAFLACFIYLRMKNISEKNILSLSNQYAAFVASQRGGMPNIPKSILHQIQ